MGDAIKRYEKHIFICTNERSPNHPRGCCTDRGGAEIRLAFVNELKDRGLKGIVRANKTGCLDACELGATVVIYPAGIWYLGVTSDDVAEIVDTSIVNDSVVKRLAATSASWQQLKDIRESDKK